MNQFHHISLTHFGRTHEQIVLGAAEQAEDYARRQASKLGAEYDLCTLSAPRVHTDHPILLLDQNVAFFECTLSGPQGDDERIIIGTPEQADRYAKSEAYNYGAEYHLMRRQDPQIETLLPVFDVSHT